MKKYLMAMLVVIIVLLGSVIFRQQNALIFNHFPVQEEVRGQSSEYPLCLFLFFSKQDCPSCISDFVKVLNGLSSTFCVVGIVPEDELKDEKTFRRITGVTFPLSSYEKYRKYVPSFRPTLIGISPAGKIIFTLPSIAVESSYLEHFILSVNEKIHHALSND
jgi:hypothetical protein